MIYEKRGMWKSSHSDQKFKTQEEAKEWENEYLGIEPLKEESNLSPLEQLRGWKDPELVEPCNECGCDPCECEWKSVEETSSETEFSNEDLS